MKAWVLPLLVAVWAPHAGAGEMTDAVLEQGRRDLIHSVSVHDPADRERLRAYLGPEFVEPADRVAYEALRSALCLEGSPDCLNWHPSGLRFDGVSFSGVAAP